MDDKIVFTLDDGEEVDLFVVDETRLNGINYLLVTDSEDDEAEAFILKDTSDDSATDAVYEIVEDDVEFNAVAKVFEELLEDIDLE